MKLKILEKKRKNLVLLYLNVIILYKAPSDWSRNITGQGEQNLSPRKIIIIFGNLEMVHSKEMKNSIGAYVINK